MKALGNERNLPLAAVSQDDAELVSGGAADDIGRAQRAGEPLSGRDDHFVGAGEAVGFVDHRELVDGRDDKSARALPGSGARDDFLQ